LSRPAGRTVKGKKKPERKLEILRDRKKRKREVEGGYYIRQPHRASAGEIENAAEAACEKAANELIDGMNERPDAPPIHYYSVKLLRIDGQTSTTKKDPWTGKQHWEGKGTGVCHVVVWFDAD
jgi:hypothetical protein